MPIYMTVCKLAIISTESASGEEIFIHWNEAKEMRHVRPVGKSNGSVTIQKTTRRFGQDSKSVLKYSLTSVSWISSSFWCQTIDLYWRCWSLISKLKTWIPISQDFFLCFRRSNWRSSSYRSGTVRVSQPVAITVMISSAKLVPQLSHMCTWAQTRTFLSLSFFRHNGSGGEFVLIR